MENQITLFDVCVLCMLYNGLEISIITIVKWNRGTYTGGPNRDFHRVQVKKWKFTHCH